jgi:hypothetical protein
VALLEFGRPLTPRQQDALAHDIHPRPHLATTWHPAPGPDVVTGILIVRGRDAILAGNAAAGTCLVALGADLPVRVAAVVRTDLTWPPDWWQAQPAWPVAR